MGTDSISMLLPSRAFVACCRAALPPSPSAAAITPQTARCQNLLPESSRQPHHAASAYTMLLRSRQASTPESRHSALRRPGRPLPSCPSTHSAKNSAKNAENNPSLVQLLAKAMCAGYSAKNSSDSRAARLPAVRAIDAHTPEKHADMIVSWITLYSAAHFSNEPKMSSADRQARISSVCSSGWNIS